MMNLSNPSQVIFDSLVFELHQDTSALQLNSPRLRMGKSWGGPCLDYFMGQDILGKLIQLTEPDHPVGIRGLSLQLITAYLMEIDPKWLTWYTLHRHISRVMRSTLRHGLTPFMYESEIIQLVFILTQQIHQLPDRLLPLMFIDRKNYGALRSPESSPTRLKLDRNESSQFELDSPRGESPTTGETNVIEFEFPIYSILINRLHYPGDVGKMIRIGLISLVSVATGSIRDFLLSQQGAICDKVISTLCAVFAVEQDAKHSESPLTPTFEEFILFLDALTRECVSAAISTHLLVAFRQVFLHGLVGPMLTRSRETTEDRWAILNTCSQLYRMLLILREVNSAESMQPVPCKSPLVQSIIEFLFTRSISADWFYTHPISKKQFVLNAEKLLEKEAQKQGIHPYHHIKMSGLPLKMNQLPPLVTESPMSSPSTSPTRGNAIPRYIILTEFEKGMELLNEDQFGLESYALFVLCEHCLTHYPDYILPYLIPSSKLNSRNISLSLQEQVKEQSMEVLEDLCNQAITIWPTADESQMYIKDWMNHAQNLINIIENLSSDSPAVLKRNIQKYIQEIELWESNHANQLSKEDRPQSKVPYSQSQENLKTLPSESNNLHLRAESLPVLEFAEDDKFDFTRKEPLVPPNSFKQGSASLPFMNLSMKAYDSALFFERSIELNVAMTSVSLALLRSIRGSSGRVAHSELLSRLSDLSTLVKLRSDFSSSKKESFCKLLSELAQQTLALWLVYSILHSKIQIF
jgi:hypothetical protein